MRERLIELERKFAPEIERGKAVFSPLDPNPHAPWELGGDKMGPDRHGYADLYAEVLDGFVPTTIVELGVFQGASLALWAAMFPDAHLIGLDLDFERYEARRDALQAAGAFPKGQPTLVTFDAYGPSEPLVKALGRRRIGLFVDDGPHTPDAIERVAGMVGPLMAKRAVYVIEDYPRGGDVLRKHFPDWQVRSSGEWSAAFRL
jgi:hypothetical protein